MTTLTIPTARVFKPMFKRARYKGAWGGRGSGKSHFFCDRLVERCIDEDLRILCGREVQKSLKESVKRLIEDKIEEYGLQYRFNVQNTQIKVGRRGVIIFQGLQNHTSESIKSLEDFDIAFIEEARNVSERSWGLLTPTIRKNSSEIWCGWNPYDPSDPVDKFFRETDGDPDIVTVKANWRNNKWFPESLKKDMERDKRRNRDKYLHVWEGHYRTQSDAQVFTNWTEEEFETPDDARFYFGADWGFSVDPSVLIRCWTDGDKMYIDQEAYNVGCETDYLPALFAGNDTRVPKKWTNPKKFEGIPGAFKWPIKADSARPEHISYLRRRGFNISGARKGAGSVEEGIEFLQSFDLVVHPRCKHTIDELTFYSYKIDPHTEEVLPVLEDKNNHVIDALRYATEGARRAANSGPRIS